MTALTFDTLKVTRSLTDAGIPEKHAEAMTSAIKEAQDSHLQELATKKDMELLEQRLLVRLGGLVIAVGGLIIAWMELRG